MLIGCLPYCIMNIVEMPVFEPNDYFWKHHWTEGKQEKWEAYADAVRHIIAEEHGDLELVDETMEDKFAFKEYLKNLKRSKTTAAAAKKTQ